MISQKSIFDKQNIGKVLERIEPYVVLNERHIRRLETSAGRLTTYMTSKSVTSPGSHQKPGPGPEPELPIRKNSAEEHYVCDMV